MEAGAVIRVANDSSTAPHPEGPRDPGKHNCPRSPSASASRRRPVTQGCPPPFGAISTSEAQAFFSMRTSFGAVAAFCTAGYPAAKPVSV